MTARRSERVSSDRERRSAGGLSYGVVALLACALAAGDVGPSSAARDAPTPGTPEAVAHAQAPPPGHTGGFGEPTCRACHGDFELNLDGDLSVEGLPERYQPGASYPLTLVLRSRGMERAGFQAAFRWTSGERRGRPAGHLTPVAASVVVDRADSGSGTHGTYVQHAPGALWTMGEEVASWSFEWTAPHDGAAPVAVHVAANSANGDNSPLGDIVYTWADTLGASTTGTMPAAPAGGPS